MSSFRQKARPPVPNIQSQFRGVTWRIYLGAVPPDADIKLFVQAVTDQRKDYKQLRAKYVDMKLEAQLPPATDKDAWRHNPWTRSFPKGMPVLETLRRDIERTYSEQEYFQDVNTRKMLERILYIWLTEEDLNVTTAQQLAQQQSSDREPLLYRQGMNELLAILVIALRRDAELASTVGDDQPQEKLLAKTVCNLKFLEHDAFVMFRCLMSWALSFYSAAITIPPVVGNGAAKEVKEPGPGYHQLTKNEAELLHGGQPEGSHPPDFARKIHRIHHIFLKQFDPALYRHFESNNVEPQLYMLRWIRVLFTREYTLDQVLKIWDRLFLTRLDLVDFVCVTMVGSMRTELFHLDSSAILMKLMKYPVLEEKQINLILATAERLMAMVICEDTYGPEMQPKTKPKPKPSSLTLPSGPSSSSSAPSPSSASSTQISSMTKTLRDNFTPLAKAFTSVGNSIASRVSGSLSGGQKRGRDRERALSGDEKETDSTPPSTSSAPAPTTPPSIASTSTSSISSNSSTPSTSSSPPAPSPSLPTPTTPTRSVNNF